MTLFLISFVVIALAAAGMAVGVLAGRPPIVSGCARARVAGGDGAVCAICGKPGGPPGEEPGPPPAGRHGDRHGQERRG